MQKYYLVENWRPRPEWHSLSKEAKERFVAGASELISAVVAHGAKVIGLGECRAISENGWEATALWEMPSIEVVDELAQGAEELGWNRYFEQVNVVSKVSSPEAYFAKLTSPRKF